jgi:hypothetical protein
MIGKCGGEVAFQKALDSEDVFEFKDSWITTYQINYYQHCYLIFL